MCLACEVRQAAMSPRQRMEQGHGPPPAADADGPAAGRSRRMGTSGKDTGLWIASAGRAGRSGGGGSTRWSGAGGGSARGEERRRCLRASTTCARARSRVDRAAVRVEASEASGRA
jgi:hypothetical protein